MISVWQLSRPALNVAWRLLAPAASAAQAKDDWSIGNYELVADLLETTDLEEAYHLTQTIKRPWWQNARVTPRFAGHSCSGGCRSTSVGDLLIDKDGAHVVCAVGFAPVELP